MIFTPKAFLIYSAFSSFHSNRIRCTCCYFDSTLVHVIVIPLFLSSYSNNDHTVSEGIHISLYFENDILSSAIHSMPFYICCRPFCYLHSFVYMLACTNQLICRVSPLTCECKICIDVYIAHFVYMRTVRYVPFIMYCNTIASSVPTALKNCMIVQFCLRCTFFDWTLKSFE